MKVVNLKRVEENQETRKKSDKLSKSDRISMQLPYSRLQNTNGNDLWKSEFRNNLDQPPYEYRLLGKRVLN